MSPVNQSPLAGLLLRNIMIGNWQVLASLEKVFKCGFFIGCENRGVPWRSRY